MKKAWEIVKIVIEAIVLYALWIIGIVLLTFASAAALAIALGIISFVLKFFFTGTYYQ